MRAAVWCCCLAVGCSFSHGTSSSDAAGGANRADAAGDAPECAFSLLVDTCTLTPGMDLILSGDHTYATDQSTLDGAPVAATHMRLSTPTGTVEALIVGKLELTANAKLRVTGSLPIAIVAFDTAQLDGGALIDLTAGGAGARTSCPGNAMPGANQGGGAGGGGGGGYAAAGGNGGDGDSDDAQQSAGGAGGTPTTPAPSGPLGGCPGASGGDGSNSGGSGGQGGGAIYVVAKNAIALATGAGINAGGEGGQGGNRSFPNEGDAGGGGGGAGGMILLETASLQNGGTLAANGGGGGEASGGGSSGNGGKT
ncbi:MAG TPA: hypothetical protein VLX92_24470, partial [Kofleriaceae bacterium]|nr:hypothetical protein [Kofleriaceae bacterium]